MRKILWSGGILALALLIIGLGLSHFGGPAAHSGTGAPSYVLTLDGAQVQATLAQTPAEQEKGLGGRDSLPAGEGMLFVFPRDGEYAFWMKDMRFPIDIIWLSADGTVIYIVPNLSPSTYPQSFGPPQPVRLVLEVPAGFAASHNVQIGDRAKLP